MKSKWKLSEVGRGVLKRLEINWWIAGKRRWENKRKKRIKIERE